MSFEARLAQLETRLSSLRPTRRGFLSGALRTSAVLAAASTGVIDQRDTSVFQPPQSQTDSLTALKRAEAIIGPGTLTREQALQYCGYAANAFVDLTGVNVTPQEMLTNTIILEHGQERRDPIVYPDRSSDAISSVVGIVEHRLQTRRDLLTLALHVPKHMYRVMAKLSNSRAFYGIHISLDSINNRSGMIQSLDQADRVTSAPASPVTLLRDRYFQDLFNYSVRQNPLTALEPNFAQAGFDNMRQDRDLRYTSQDAVAPIGGRAVGFIANVEFTTRSRETYDKSVVAYVLFNDMTEKYMSHELFKKMGLPYIPGFLDYDKDMGNMRTLLSQSGISFEELLRLYRGSKVDEFVQRVADGIHDDTLKPEEKYQIAFRGTIGGHGFRINWDTLKPYYREIS